MAADLAKVDSIIQYSLLVAGEEEDFTDRDLGPIHLIKYVFLADLLHASRHAGATYTGIDWIFYKFGPWSQEVNKRIEPALATIFANKKTFESDYGNDDWSRWSRRDEYTLNRIEEELPAAITLGLSRLIREFSKNTHALLDHVYKTKPMLHAAPNERLDFSLAVTDKKFPETPKPLRFQALSNNKKKQFAEKMTELRQRNTDRWARRSQRGVDQIADVGEDQAFQQVVEWLDSLAGENLQEETLEISFSDQVWKSEARKGDDLL